MPQKSLPQTGRTNARWRQLDAQPLGYKALRQFNIDLNSLHIAVIKAPFGAFIDSNLRQSEFGSPAAATALQLQAAGARDDILPPDNFARLAADRDRGGAAVHVGELRLGVRHEHGCGRDCVVQRQRERVDIGREHRSPYRLLADDRAAKLVPVAH